MPAAHAAILTATGDVSLRPTEGHRTADPTFTSAAAACGPKVLAAVLTGRLDDAALGVRHVKGAGGRVGGPIVEVATVGDEGMIGLPIFLGAGTPTERTVRQVSGAAFPLAQMLACAGRRSARSPPRWPRTAASATAAG